MKVLLRCLLVLGSVAILAACANHRYDLVDASPYNAYVNKKIPLQREAFLDSDWTQTYKLLLDADDISGFKKDKLLHVPEGSLILVERVELRIGYDSIHAYTAYGRVFFKNNDNPIKFQYLWGWYDTIKRAPWENAMTPSKRYVGPNGLKYLPTLVPPQPNFSEG